MFGETDTHLNNLTTVALFCGKVKEGRQCTRLHNEVIDGTSL